MAVYTKLDKEKFNAILSNYNLGEIKRYLVMINDWHWGHVIQFQNSYFPKWKSGEVYDLPIPQPHCSANIGMRIKLTCSISGAKTK